MQHRISRADYLAKTQALQQHIARGDIYEVNFCMELYAEDANIEPHRLFQELNQKTKSPFSAFIQIVDKYLLSSSPERFLKRVGDRLISQPIKGTAQRHTDMVQDAAEASQLQKSEKERAENTMIVDLVRNDMSRIATKGSVQVEELCKVYPFAHVHQMISTIAAELQIETQVSDAIAACFPMGSMTGAPKVRAMQLIEQYEETKRGLYSGAVGYIDPNGDFDFNVVIRSLLYRKDTEYLSLQVGSALTASSNPEKEYDECLLKAKGVLEVLSKKMAINL
jgi:para-aminobenzoate synthetase component 1